jgi:hypothetical protein
MDLPLSRWDNFYVIVGSSAGALTGLQFVVMTLIADSHAASMLEVRAFGSPTVVHFCAALLISAIASAPWGTLSAATIAFAICGVLGVLYSLYVIRHARRQQGYRPDVEDWSWYIVLPIFEYVLLLVGAALLNLRAPTALFLIAATSLLLLFNGIHNSWDTVTYVAVQRQKNKQRGNDERAA